MEDYKNMTAIEINHLINKTKDKHEEIKSNIKKMLFETDELEKKINKSLLELQSVEEKYVELVSVLINKK